MKKSFLLVLILARLCSFVLSSCGNEEQTQLIESLQESIDQLEQENEKLSKENTDKDNELSNLKEELASFQKEISDLESKDAANQAKITELNEAYNTKVAELESEKNAIESAIATLEAERKAEVDGLNANISELETAYKNKVAELETEKAANADALAALESEYIAEIESLKAENANLSSQIADLKAQIDMLLKGNCFIATFYINDGEGAIEDQIIPENMTVKEPTTPTKVGYDFLGWYVNGVKAEFPYIITTNTKFVAEYAPTKYTISYNTNGGTMPETYATEYNVETSVTLPAPTRDLYLFAGWYADADFTGEKVTALPTGTSGDRTLYAKWLSTTNGIQYKLENNGTSYTVTGYDGSDTAVVIPDVVNGVPVTAIAADAFRNKQRITAITVPDSVTSIGYRAFEFCISLTELNLGSGIRSIPDSMAFGCDKLQSITIPDNVTSIYAYAFSGCDVLTSVVIPDSVTSIGVWAFDYCSALTDVYITDLSKWCSISFSNYASNPLYYAKNLYLDGELVTELVIPDGVTSISGVFFHFETLTSVVIPDSVTSISGAFYGCSSLVSVVIGNSVTSIASAFWGCSALTSVVIPDSVTSIGSEAFYGCSALTSVAIPNSVTSIGSEAFYGCSALTSVVIPDSVTSIGSKAFYGCSNLAIVYNDSDLLIELGSTNNGYVAYYAEVLVENGIIISANDGYHYTLTEDVFLFREKDSQYQLISYASGQKTVTLPATINGNFYTLYKMRGVRNIIIPTSFTEISNYAFDSSIILRASQSPIRSPRSVAVRSFNAPCLKI